MSRLEEIAVTPNPDLHRSRFTENLDDDDDETDSAVDDGEQALLRPGDSGWRINKHGEESSKWVQTRGIVAEVGSYILRNVFASQFRLGRHYLPCYLPLLVSCSLANC